MNDTVKTRIFRGAKRHKVKQLIHQLLHGAPSVVLLTSDESEPLMERVSCPCGEVFHLVPGADYTKLK